MLWLKRALEPSRRLDRRIARMRVVGVILVLLSVFAANVLFSSARPHLPAGVFAPASFLGQVAFFVTGFWVARAALRLPPFFRRAAKWDPEGDGPSRKHRRRR